MLFIVDVFAALLFDLFLLITTILAVIILIMSVITDTKTLNLKLQLLHRHIGW